MKEDSTITNFNSKKPIGTLIKLLNLNIPVFIGYAILYFIKFSPDLLTPLYLKQIYAFAKNPESEKLVFFIVINIIFLLVVIQNIFTHSIFVKLVHSRVRKMEQELRSSLIKKLQQLSIAFHTKTESGRLQSKVLRDVDDIANLTIQLFHQGFSTIISITWCLVITFTSDWIVGVFFIISAPITALVINFFKKKMNIYNHEYRTKMEQMSSRVSEMINTIPITRAHGVENEEIKKTDIKFDSVYHAALQLDYTNQMFGASTWVMLKIAIVNVMMFCGFLAYNGRMEIENIILYYGLFQMIVGSFTNALSFTPIFNRGFEALKSLGEVLESPDIEQNIGKKWITETKGAINFENVNFSYDSLKPAIKNFNANISPGQCIAFVGESGSGKSTLMNLLIGFWRPDNGKILLDDLDYESIDLRSWRQHLAVVPQNTILFSGTILENICYGKNNIDCNSVQNAVDAANLRSFVDSLPNGLNTMVQENGKNLSGGQKQRISIARALIRDPKIIIFDEATSALDVVSEKEVQDAIDNMIKGRTTFIVAHRLSTIRNANRVFVMKDGECIEEGTQEELLKLNGEFSRLKRLQI